MMVLIEADRWLGELETDLAPGGRRPAKSALEQRLRDRAGQARQYLRFAYDPTTPAAKLPPPSPARITNHIGDGISQFAYAGSIGPIFPAASDILALNQRWVSDVIHHGAIRTAFQNAHSTSLVLDAISPASFEAVVGAVNQDDKSGRFYPPSGSADQQVVTALKRPMMSFLMGHLASVAAHVVLGPFVNARVWAPNGIDRRTFQVQLDAQVARTYFKLGDLHAGETWTKYLPDDSKSVALIGELYYQALQRTYGTDPSKRIDPPPDSPYKAPTLDRDFLIDGYLNVRNWALDSGYDHGPWSFRLILGGVFVGAMGLLLLLTKSHFDAPQGSAAPSSRFKLWQDKGFFENEWLIFDALDWSYGMPGYILGLGLNWLLNSPIPGTTFIFARGTTSFFKRPAGYITFKIVKIAYKATKLLLTLLEPDIMTQPIIRWPRLGIDVGLDITDYAFVSTPAPEKFHEGDALSIDLWLIGLPVAGVFVVASLATFGLKSIRGGAGTRESGMSGWDFAIGMGFVSLGWLILAAVGLFDDWPLRQVVGTPWPQKTTTQVDAYLPLDAKSAPQTFPVKVFAPGDLVTVDGQPAYPQDDTASIAWVDRPAHDEAIRRAKAKDSTRADYTFAELSKLASYLAGTFMMAAVNYDVGSADDKTAAREVFRDWNLDYRTQEEWDSLIEVGPGARVGVARAVDRWWTTGSSELAVLEPLEQAFNLKWRPPAGATHYGRIEDRSAAPDLGRSDTGHRYLASTPFTIVDGGGTVVFSGTTDSDGHYSASLAAGSTYELRIANFQGLGP